MPPPIAARALLCTVVLARSNLLDRKHVMLELTVLGNRDEVALPGGGCQSGSCGSSADQLAHLPEHIRERIHNHPCYSEQAHHHYARMHVAVAPACNIQCNFCNRKYDCSNESRPGVVSELLTPRQAVKKTLAVAAKIPQMSVLGIAGPGDPLANPERTFATFRMLREQAPDIKLCLSTNGLALPEWADELTSHNIDHVTITINCIDPEVGARIYPWIYWDHRRIRGVEASRILIDRQQRGLEMLVERNILVKVNSVMIPGINDDHLAEVSKTVQAKGAFLHNVMPLIAEPEHGTYFGLMGKRGPTPAELTELQDRCGGQMNMMRHCRQCRADAVGLLGEDRGAEFSIENVEAMEIDYAAAMEKRQQVHAAIAETLSAQTVTPAIPSGGGPIPDHTPTVLMAVASKGGGLVNQHFGHAREFSIYEASPRGVRMIGHRKTDLYCEGSSRCGDSEELLRQTLQTLADCDAVLCSKIGYEPWEALEKAGIEPSGQFAMVRIEQAVQQMYEQMYHDGKLSKNSQQATA